jgi:hypothetical protein
MIKNLAYSVFLHSLILFLLYANFKIHQPRSTKTKEIKVGFMVVDNSKDALSQIESTVNQIKEAPQNLEKITPKTSEQKIKKQTLEQLKPTIPNQKPQNINKPSIIAKIKPNSVKSLSNTDQINVSQPEKSTPELEYKAVPSNEKIETNQEKLDNTDENSISTNEINSNNKTLEIINSRKTFNFEANGLSNRQKFNIQAQIKLCYQRAIFESRKYSNQKVVTKAKINQDGTIESDIYQQIKSENYLDPNNYQYKIAIDNVKRALELCSPIRNIPSNITEQLQDLIFEFEGN